MSTLRTINSVDVHNLGARCIEEDSVNGYLNFASSRLAPVVRCLKQYTRFGYDIKKVRVQTSIVRSRERSRTNEGGVLDIAAAGKGLRT